MAGINIDMPIFNADDLLDPQARRRLISYLYRLAEQVKYLAGHIDGDNVTDDFKREMISTASAKAKDDLTGTLTEYETKIEQNAREIETRATQTEVNALGEEIETASSAFTQTATALTTRVESAEGKASQAQQTANGFSARITSAENTASSARSTANSASSRVSSLELKLDGLFLSIDNNRLAFTANGLTIKNAQGQTVFSQSTSTGNLTLSGSIDATGGTIGGFTIGSNSISGPNGVNLLSTGNSSTVNNIKLRSGVDSFGSAYTLISPNTDSGYNELRLGMFSGLSQEGLRLYAQDGQLRVEIGYNLYSTGGAYFLNTPAISGVSPNMYIDSSGRLYRVV